MATNKPSLKDILFDYQSLRCKNEHVEEMATGKLRSTAHPLPAYGTHLITHHELLSGDLDKPFFQDIANKNVTVVPL